MRISWAVVVRESLVVSVAASTILIVSKIDFAHSGRLEQVPASQTKLLPPAGIDTTLEINGKAVENQSIALVLFLRPSCQYCIASKPFYQRLAARSKQHSIRLYVVISQESSTAAFLKSASLDSFSRYAFADLNISVSATPTLLALNSSGAIKRLWTGALSEKRESDVISLLADVTLLEQVPSMLPTGEPNIAAKDISRLSPERRHLLLDVRERDEFLLSHRDGAVNIPLIELPTRVTHELDSQRLTMVDCSHLRSRLCQNAVDRLAEHGFRRVVAVNGHMAEGDACRFSEVKP